jgi:hypothetical protein
MACTPAHCNSNCYSDTCAVNAPACPTNETNFGTTLIKGNTVLTSHVNDLRISIDDERTSRRGFSEDFPTSVDSDDEIEQQHAVDMKDSINEMVNADDGILITDTYSNLVSAGDVEDLRTSINELRADCVCDSECGANSICGCHGDCGNNYSDRRLKKEIKYI